MKTTNAFAAAVLAIFSIAGSASAVPEILVYANGGHVVTENVSPKYEDLTHFGSVLTAGGEREHNFYIRNIGDSDLVINSISITGTGAGSFSVPLPPEGVVPPNNFTFFKIACDPTSDGLKNAKITIGSNAPGNSLFGYNVAGIGVASITAKPDLSAGIITTLKEKIIEKNGVTYLKGVYQVPIENYGSATYTKKTSVMKVFSSIDNFLDNNDTIALKILPIKKSIEAGDAYTMKVKVKVEIPPGTKRIIFQIESPDDYEDYFGNNMRIESYP